MWKIFIIFNYPAVVVLLVLPVEFGDNIVAYIGLNIEAAEAEIKTDLLC